jgi:hypothetical protein
MATAEQCTAAKGRFEKPQAEDQDQAQPAPKSQG